MTTEAILNLFQTPDRAYGEQFHAHLRKLGFNPEGGEGSPEAIAVWQQQQEALASGIDPITGRPLTDGQRAELQRLASIYDPPSDWQQATNYVGDHLNEATAIINPMAYAQALGVGSTPEELPADIEQQGEQALEAIVEHPLAVVNPTTWGQGASIGGTAAVATGHEDEAPDWAQGGGDAAVVTGGALAVPEVIGALGLQDELSKALELIGGFVGGEGGGGSGGYDFKPVASSQLLSGDPNIAPTFINPNQGQTRQGSPYSPQAYGATPQNPAYLQALASALNPRQGYG